MASYFPSSYGRASLALGKWPVRGNAEDLLVAGRKMCASRQCPDTIYTEGYAIYNDDDDDDDDRYRQFLHDLRQKRGRTIEERRGGFFSRGHD